MERKIQVSNYVRFVRERISNCNLQLVCLLRTKVILVEKHEMTLRV